MCALCECCTFTRDIMNYKYQNELKIDFLSAFKSLNYALYSPRKRRIPS